MLKREMSEGARQLGDALSPKLTQKALAQALGVTPQAVSSWVVGRARPSPPLRAAIERITGIPADAWLTDQERALIESVQAPRSA